MLRTADNRDVVVDDPAVLDRLDLSRGQVDDDVALIEGKIEPGKAVGARGELSEAHLCWNVDRLQRGARDDPRLSKPHAPLEALHRRRQAIVPSEPARLCGGEIAFDRQALAQFCD